jgi:hypothetical protein
VCEGKNAGEKASVCFLSMKVVYTVRGMGIAETGRVPLRQCKGEGYDRQLSWAPKI